MSITPQEPIACQIHNWVQDDCAACHPPIVPLDPHGPVMARADVVPGKWYLREDALPPEGLHVLCVHNRGTWLAPHDQVGVNMVVLCRVDFDPEKYVCPNNRGASYEWRQFGPDNFFGHSIDRWMRPTGIDDEATP